MNRTLASITAGVLALGLTDPASADARLAGGLAGLAEAPKSIDTIGYYYRGYRGPRFRYYGYGPYYGYGGYRYRRYGYGRYGYRYYRPYYGGHHRYYGHRYPYRRFQTESDG